MVAAGHPLAVGLHFEPAAELAVAVGAALALDPWSAVKSGRYYDDPIVQRQLATVSEAAVLHIAPNGERMRALLQMQSQHLPATCAEERSWQVPAVDVIHLEAIHCK